jgi:hypothetical protein
MNAFCELTVAACPDATNGSLQMRTLTPGHAAPWSLMALPPPARNRRVAALAGFIAFLGISIQSSVILMTCIRGLRKENMCLLDSI